MSDEKKSDSYDKGLETMLHLLEPDLGLPNIAVDTREVHLTLDKGITREIPIRIKNTGRGVLFGTLALNPPVNGGVSLSHNTFNINSKTLQEFTVTLRVDGSEIGETQIMDTSIEVHSNAALSCINIPAFIRVKRNILMESIGLWLVTLPLVILLTWLLYDTVAAFPYYQIEILQEIGPYFIVGAGFVGTILYNIMLSSSTSGGNNMFKDYFLSVTACFLFAAVAYLLIGVILAALAIVAVLAVIAIFFTFMFSLLNDH